MTPWGHPSGKAGLGGRLGDATISGAPFKDDSEPEDDPEDGEGEGDE